MLRVRPIVSTSNPSRYGDLLSVLGLHVATENGDCRVYDAGSGRVVLRSPQPASAGGNSVALGFEVGDATGDLDEFARRTRQEGTAVDVVGQGHGRAARVSAPDGATFLAVPGPRSTPFHGGPLSVVALWHTPDSEAAETVLLGIGARPRRTSSDGTRQDFAAKNGGLIAVHPAGETFVTLGFEYDGDVQGLTGSLRATGIGYSVHERNQGRSLRIPIPGHAPLVIDERR